MAGHRFFVPPEKIDSTTALIEGEEAYHLRKVLRLGPGDEVRIFDGTGREMRAVIDQMSAQAVTLRIVEHLTNLVESPLSITLAQGLIKGERFEVLIQKATELGVTTLQPLATKYTDVRLNEARAEKRLERWGRIVLEAAKQSGRRRLMTILPPIGWDEFVGSASQPVIFFSERGGQSLEQIASKIKSPELSAITAVVGSEGGWSELEIAEAESSGFHMATLGPRILRAETAGIAAVVLLQYLFGDLV
jgi:16S rRNA (uracil1498-N3)-methyltransferase